MSYKMILTAERGWFFVQTDHAQILSPGPVIFRVAAWALTEDDKVVGLIGLGIHGSPGTSDNRQTHLHEPPIHVNGEYRHYNDLTQAELTYLGSDQNRPNRQNI